MKKIPNLSKKALIISLIKDDLIHSRLVYGFEMMGVDANDYMLHLTETIFELAGISPKHKRIEEIMDNYMRLTRKVKRIHVLRQKDKLERLAEDVYLYLRIVGK